MHQDAHVAAPAAPVAARSIAEVLAAARAGTSQVSPHELRERMGAGAVVVDLRPVDRRDSEGHLPGAVVVDRLVLEWRLDPQGPHRMADGPGYSDDIILVCNEGYSSSLAARDLRELGFQHVTDLAGGFRAWVTAGLPTSTVPTRHVC